MIGSDKNATLYGALSFKFQKVALLLKTFWRHGYPVIDRIATVQKRFRAGVEYDLLLAGKQVSQRLVMADYFFYYC